MRHGPHRPPLQAPYYGPFNVLKHHSKTFLLDLNGKKKMVSLDRLKIAHGVTQQLEASAINMMPISNSSFSQCADAGGGNVAITELNSV